MRCKGRRVGVMLLAILLAASFSSSCLPWKKKAKEEKKEELKWAWSRPRRSTRRSAVTYGRRPYLLPREETKPKEVRPRPTLPPVFLGRLKYKVVVLEFAEGEGASEFKGIGRLAAQKLGELLASSSAAVVVDRGRLEGISGPLDSPEALWRLWKALGIHAVIKGSVKKAMVGEEKGGALALVGIEAFLYSTETGGIVKGAYGQNPLYLSRTQGPARRQKALEKALKEALEEVKNGLLIGLGQMEWSTSVASVDRNTVYLNAGSRSGLKEGEILEVYGPGEEVKNPLTGVALGRAPGPKKGRVKVEEFFGVDASKAVLLEGEGIEPGDVVKPSKAKSRP